MSNIGLLAENSYSLNLTSLKDNDDSLAKTHLKEYVLTSRLLHNFQYPNFRLPNLYDLF